jgi:hypothetical protein
MTDFAGDFVFGFDGAEVGEEFAHPVFGETVVDIAWHGLSRTFEPILSDGNGEWHLPIGRFGPIEQFCIISQQADRGDHKQNARVKRNAAPICLGIKPRKFRVPDVYN